MLRDIALYFLLGDWWARQLDAFAKSMGWSPITTRNYWVAVALWPIEMGGLAFLICLGLIVSLFQRPPAPEEKC